MRQVNAQSLHVWWKSPAVSFCICAEVDQGEADAGRVQRADRGILSIPFLRNASVRCARGLLALREAFLDICGISHSPPDGLIRDSGHGPLCDSIGTGPFGESGCPERSADNLRGNQAYAPASS